MVVFNKDIVSSLSYFIFKFLIFICFGKNRYIMMHDEVSVIILNNINIDIWIDMG